MLIKNNGVSLIALVFTIIVILMLASVFISTSLRSLEETRKSEIQNEINAIETAAAMRYSSYLKNSNDEILVGVSPSSTSKVNNATNCINVINEYAELNENEKEMIKNHFDSYIKIITKDVANELGVGQFKNDSIYIVDYCTSSAYGPISKQDIGM